MWSLTQTCWPVRNGYVNQERNGAIKNVSTPTPTHVIGIVTDVESVSALAEPAVLGCGCQLPVDIHRQHTVYATRCALRGHCDVHPGHVLVVDGNICVASGTLRAGRRENKGMSSVQGCVIVR